MLVYVVFLWDGRGVTSSTDIPVSTEQCISLVDTNITCSFQKQTFDKVDEKCCAERMPRYFIFILDNTHSTFRSKTLVYDMLISDAIQDDNESDCVERFQQSYQSEEQPSAEFVHALEEPCDHTDTAQSYNNDIEISQGHSEQAYAQNDNTYADDNDTLNDNNNNNTHSYSHSQLGDERGDLDQSDVDNGWGLHYDEHGYPYYYNSLTEASQWEHPSNSHAQPTSHSQEGWSEQEQHEKGDDGCDGNAGSGDGSGSGNDVVFADIGEGSSGGSDSSEQDQAQDQDQSGEAGALNVDLVTLSSIAKGVHTHDDDDEEEEEC